MIKALSHIVIASNDVKNITDFFKEVFSIEPHFSNDEFSDFVLPCKRRIAFFKPVGKAANFFEVNENPTQVSYGVTVEDVDLFYNELMLKKDKYSFSVSGAPKEHPWGEKSFLLIDPDKNRWEITQSPSEHGNLVNR